MKKYLLLASCFLLLGLSACTSQKNTQRLDFEGEQVDTVGVGESCAERSCHKGLECDKDFVCVNLVVDPNMVCPENQAPVCGFRDGRKNGYLNECEARRHGAAILYEGFCETDPSVEGDCEAEVVSMGNCRRLFTGYEFDGSKCREVQVGGCEADIPFASMEACEQTCR